MNCKPTPRAPRSAGRSLCSSKPARQTTRSCRSRLQTQTKVWFCLPNIKLPVVVSVATDGNRRRAKAFGFPSFCDQKSRSTIPDVIRTEFSLEPATKLPNDVRLSGRKVAGVLAEMRAQEKAPHLAVVGIGINVNQSLEDFPPKLQSRATSLAMALHRPVDRRQLAVALLQYLDRTYRERFTDEALQS